MSLHPVMMTYLSKLGHFPLAFFSETKSVAPNFFSVLDYVIYDLTSGEKCNKCQRGKIFVRMSLIVQ